MKPYFKTELGKLYCGDIINVLQKISNESFDFILADPPYNISRSNNFATMERYDSYKGIDFGEWDKEFDIKTWIKLAITKLKKNANFVCFSAWQNLGSISAVCNECGLSIKRPMIIKKTNPMPTNKERLYLNSFEFAVWCAKGKWVFNNRKKYEEAFFECSVESRIKHPTVKNIEAIENIVKVLSNPEQIILDPFLGSGTTAVACERLNRKWVGIEISEEYCEMSKKRIQKESNQKKLF